MPTLTTYLQTFKTVKGLLAAAVGVTAPGLAVLDKVAPPVPESAAIATIIFGLAVIGTYAFCRWQALRDRACYRTGVVALAAGAVLGAVYLLHLTPTYIYTPQTGYMPGPRLIVADEAGYRDEAREYIRGAETKTTLIEGSCIEDLFTENSLFWARLKLLSVYNLSVLLLEVGFCFLVYAEAARRA